MVAFELSVNGEGRFVGSVGGVSAGFPEPLALQSPAGSQVTLS
jgi:hypothetical protein